jgi:Flp pilus assembly protein TadG
MIHRSTLWERIGRRVPRSSRSTETRPVGRRGPVACCAGLLRFLRNDRAAAALEFAIGGSIFILLICMIIEVDLIIFTQSVLDNAARDAARLIRTGQIQNAGGSVTPFTNRLCTDVGSLIPCSKIQYNVQSASQFSSLNATVKINGSGQMKNTQFTPGTAGQDVLVQVGYYRKTIVPWLQTYLTNNQMLVSTIAFQNDPY